jgi:prevent-host-death family protein
VDSVPLQDARDRLGVLVDQVAHGHRHVQITRHSRPSAVLIPVSDYEDFQRLREDEMRRRIAAWSQQAQDGDMTGLTRVTRAELAGDSEDWLA